MPLKKRLLHDVSNYHRKDNLEESTPENYLQDQNVSGMLGTMNQLTYLSLFALEIFQNLAILTEDVNERIKFVSVRTTSLYKNMKKIDNIMNTIDQNDRFPVYSGLESYLSSREMFTPSILTKQTNYNSISTQYDLCKLPPQIWRIELITEQDCYKDYSNPSYFFQEWLRNEVLKQYHEKIEKKKNKLLKKQLKQERKKMKHLNIDIEDDDNNQDLLVGSDEDLMYSQTNDELDTINTNQSQLKYNKFRKSLNIGQQRNRSLLVKYDRLNPTNNNNSNIQSSITIQINNNDNCNDITNIVANSNDHNNNTTFDDKLYNTLTENEYPSFINEDNIKVDNNSANKNNITSKKSTDLFQIFKKKTRDSVIRKSILLENNNEEIENINDHNQNNDNNIDINNLSNYDTEAVIINNNDNNIEDENLLSFSIPIVKKPKNRKQVLTMKVGNHFISSVDNNNNNNKKLKKSNLNKLFDNNKTNRETKDFSHEESVIDSQPHIKSDEINHIDDTNIKIEQNTLLKTRRTSVTKFHSSFLSTIFGTGFITTTRDNNHCHTNDNNIDVHTQRKGSFNSSDPNSSTRRYSMDFDDYKSRSQNILDVLQETVLTVEDKALLLLEEIDDNASYSLEYKSNIDKDDRYNNSSQEDFEHELDIRKSKDINSSFDLDDDLLSELDAEPLSDNGSQHDDNDEDIDGPSPSGTPPYSENNSLDDPEYDILAEIDNLNIEEDDLPSESPPRSSDDDNDEIPRNSELSRERKRTPAPPPKEIITSQNSINNLTVPPPPPPSLPLKRNSIKMNQPPPPPPPASHRLSVTQKRNSIKGHPPPPPPPAHRLSINQKRNSIKMNQPPPPPPPASHRLSINQKRNSIKGPPPPPPSRRESIKKQSQEKPTIKYLPNADQKVIDTRGSLLQSIQLGAVQLKSAVTRPAPAVLPKSVKVSSLSI